jgi:hypothetical protein
MTCPCNLWIIFIVYASIILDENALLNKYFYFCVEVEGIKIGMKDGRVWKS